MNAILLALALALAQGTPAADCEPLPAIWSGWTASENAAAPLKPGVRNAVALKPADAAALLVKPEKAPAPGTFAGTIGYDVAKAGRVQIALDVGAWIDLVRDGKALESVTHGHGPKCSGIRKIVGFDVQPGHYTIQIVGAPSASAGVMAIAAD